MGIPTRNPEFWSIHKALHSPNVNSLVLRGRLYRIYVSKNNGCRYLVFDKIMFMEQNQAKATKYAEKAREGVKITWGIMEGSDWILMSTPELPASYYLSRQIVKTINKKL